MPFKLFCSDCGWEDGSHAPDCRWIDAVGFGSDFATRAAARFIHDCQERGINTHNLLSESGIAHMFRTELEKDMSMPPLHDRDKTCLTFSCTAKPEVRFRGLCMKCWSKAKKLVDSGKVSWDKLAELGMVESEKDAFELELEKRLKGTLPEGP